MRCMLLLLSLSTMLYALPVGNVAQASLYKRGVFFDPCRVDPCSTMMMFAGALDLRLGFYGDYSWNRRMVEYVLGSSQNAIAKVNMRTDAAYPVINIYNWMDVFATFGVSKIGIDRLSKETNSPSVTNYSEMFSWSVGTHATLFRRGAFYIGGMGQYFRTQPHLSNHMELGVGEIVSFNNTNPAVWEEWQVAGGVALDIVNELGTAVVPYFAIKISQGKFETKNIQYVYNGINERVPTLEPDLYYGWALGCTLLCQEAMSVTVEGRWLAESGIFVDGQLRF